MEVIEHSLDEFEHVVLETETETPGSGSGHKLADPEARRIYRRELIRAADRVAPLVELYARRLAKPSASERREQERTNMQCEHCGSLLSAVTWTCVRGAFCPGARPSTDEAARESAP